jgi:uncharacterized protein (TIGR02246 family)
MPKTPDSTAELRFHQRATAKITQLLAGACMICTFAACSPRVDGVAEEQAIRAVLENQREAWNRSDLHGYMQGYWNDPKLRFASGASIENGWQQTLQRYQSRYTTPELMGQLTFDIIDIHVVDPNSAYVFGRWSLARDLPAGPIDGLFTLILAKINGHWVIVHDHTSARPAAAPHSLGQTTS